MNKLISVIVPVYNVENYLPQCISSITSQTYKDLEIILVDDGSTDKSGKICDNFSKKDRRIKVIHKSNGGLSSARNCGIENAKGDFLTFIDSDDFIKNTMLEKLISLLASTSSDISIGNRIYYYSDTHQYTKFPDTKKIFTYSTQDALINLLATKDFDMSAWAKLYRKELFKNLRFPEGKICEDYYIMYKLFSSAQKVAYTTEPLYCYRQDRNDSITKKATIKYDFIDAAKEQSDYLSKYFPQLSKYAKSAYALSFLTVYSQYLLNGGKKNSKLLSDFKTKMRRYKKCVYHNPYLTLRRKIQFWVFIHASALYSLLYSYSKQKEARC